MFERDGIFLLLTVFFCVCVCGPGTMLQMGVYKRVGVCVWVCAAGTHSRVMPPLIVLR